MDNNVIRGGINSNIELTNVSEQNCSAYVPKIRIRLRPNSDQNKNNSQINVCGTLGDRQECDTIIMDVSKSDKINQTSETKCYKILEDSGGGGDSQESNKEVRHNYMIHGINLRTRHPKPLSMSKKMKTKNDVTNENKSKISFEIDSEVINKPPKKSICTKNPFISFILNSSKNHRKNEKNHRKSVSKVRNEILNNINLKDIINQTNFLKLSSEMQWHLVNLLPQCDKPKSQNNQSNCHCSDNISNLNEIHNLYPIINFTALNNEFLGKALTKYSLKMGQCDLINLLTSERENLRSRPVTLLNEDISMIESIECSMKDESQDHNSNIDNDNNTENKNDDGKVLDDAKSNTSVCTTETMEMNCIGNGFENMSLKLEHTGCYEKNASLSKNEFVEEFKCKSDDIKVDESQCDNFKSFEETVFFPEENSSLVNNSLLTDQYKQFESDYTNLAQLNIDTDIISHDLDSSNLFDDKKRKRGRKRKCFSLSEDSVIMPVKRSNRSTAGKRPARLDSESPPTSPNHISSFDRKNHHIKYKKQKEHNRNLRKCHRKQELSSDEFESKSKSYLLLDNASQYSKNCPSSPESLPTESDLSSLSKPSPNGSSILSSFCRSSLVSLYNDKKTSSHVNSIQALSPTWSCTSESTTPSVKSDCGQMPQSKNSPILLCSNWGHSEMRSSNETEKKLIQGMPPPRQTLTLAAMREKMRAKKLAKEDNKKDTLSSNKRQINHFKNRKHDVESSSLLKEGDDDFQLMDKMMSSSEEFDDLLNNSQDSLLEFFMGDDNYDFEANVDQCSNINSLNQKSCITKKVSSKRDIFPEELFCKDEDSQNCEEQNIKTEDMKSPKSVADHASKPYINNSSSNPPSNESTQSGKSIADTIATVLQKFNCSKENGLVVNNCVTKSVPNAYLVDGNGLSSALSIIQSLNPGAKVTTQQFYLVNSGPQLILQPSPPTNIVSDKSPPLNIQTKVSLAPKIINQPSIIRQSSILSNSLPSSNDGFSTIPINQLTFASNINDKSLNITHESLCQSRNSCIQMSINDSKNTFVMSPNTHSVPNVNHLQTISTPHPIGLVQSVPSPLPPLFSSQLRFIHPSLTNQTSQNTISLIAPNIPPTNTTPIVNNNQSPKLVFFCPTIPNNTVTTSNVLNQEQKYLLLSKQPDKQATIQLLSSQGLWQQLNPSLISQPNNLLVMQPQTLNNFDSLLCSNVHNIGLNIGSDVATLNERSRLLEIHQQQQHKQQFIEASTSSLIIDSRSLISKLSPQIPNDDAIPTLSSPLSYAPHSNCTLNSSTFTPFYNHDETAKVDLNTLRIDNTTNHHLQDLSQS